MSSRPSEVLLRIFYFGGQEDCASAGAENWTVVRGEFSDGFVEAFFLEKLELGGAFAAGEDQAVAAFEIGERCGPRRFLCLDRQAFSRVRRSRLELRGFRFSNELH